MTQHGRRKPVRVKRGPDLKPKRVKISRSTTRVKRKVTHKR